MTNRTRASSTFWDGLIGHRASIDQLQRAISRDTLPHALLLVGPEGIGKAKLARAIAGEKLLTGEWRVSDDTVANSLRGESTGAREEQRRLLELGNHPDIHLLVRDPEKKDIAVDAVRELCSGLRLKPYYSRASISIIDNAHELTIAACNALLLTLEEPPPHASFILVTHAPQRLPATILSRCQTVYCGVLSASELEAVLLTVAPELTPKERAELLVLCDGSLAPLGISSFFNQGRGIVGKGPVKKSSSKTSAAKTSPAKGGALKAARDSSSTEGENIERDETNPELLEHLRRLTSDIAKTRAVLMDYFSSDPARHPTSAKALQTAGLLATAVDEDPDRTWRLIHSVLRTNLTSDPFGSAGRWPELLLESLASEKLVRERNVNATLQLSHLCLQHAQ